MSSENGDQPQSSPPADEAMEGVARAYVELSRRKVNANHSTGLDSKLKGMLPDPAEVKKEIKEELMHELNEELSSVGVKDRENGGKDDERSKEKDKDKERSKKRKRERSRSRSKKRDRSRSKERKRS
jgi:hypothetical protein